ncbi:MAG: acetyltransferase [Gammaproteobacteria bacterium]|nr:acetyltransferase [Gammaproteobacteria bacterium]
MFLKHKPTGRLVEVLSLNDLFNPYHTRLVGRFHYGEEIQDPEQLPKAEFVFPSGEALPRCWLDPHYRDEQVFARRVGPKR